MAEIGTEPDLESKIRRLTGSGFGVLVFGAGSGFNFSDSVHLWRLPSNIEADILVTIFLNDLFNNLLFY